MVPGLAFTSAFGSNWLADVTRLVLCIPSMFLVLLCVRVAWLRAKAPRGHPLREQSPWAVLSYACFAFIPTVNGFRNFGHPLDPLLTPIFAFGLFCGFVAAFGQVTIRLWTGKPPPTESEEEPSDGRDG